MTAFWHPFSDMGAVERDGEFVLARGEGSVVWDEAGNRYLDATAGLWYAMVGHGRGEIADAAAAQMRTIAAHSAFGDMGTRPTISLAERIAAVSPIPDAKVFLTSGGSDSIDTAGKLARRYWSERGEPHRVVMIGREKAYHGVHAYGTSLGGIPANAAGHGELVHDVVHVPWDSAAALAAAIERIGPERVAAFFCEPVIGAGGVFPPPDGYLDEVRRICRDTGVLFVADEVITGFGRCGDWFASGRFGLDPDLIVFAKGVTSGYLPLGGVIVSPRVWEPFWRPGAFWRHGYTYSGHAAVAASAHANLDIFEREGICAQALALESKLAAALAPLAGHELVHEVRSGTGALAAIQLDAADPAIGNRAVAVARRHGVVARNLVGNAIQVSPPLVLTDAEVAELAGSFRAMLDDLAASS